MFEFFTDNELISSNQSGFKPAVNWYVLLMIIINLSMTASIQELSFLTCQKHLIVFYEGLLYKLKQYVISDNLLNIIVEFLSLRKQRVVLNGQYSTWVNIDAGVPQGSILGPLFFLSNLVQNINSATADLNSDLSKISDRAFQWKTNFNPDPNKQTQEVIFSIKIDEINHPPLLFNQSLVKSSSSQKHLGMVLNTKLDFNLYLKNVQSKVNKTI